MHSRSRSAALGLGRAPKRIPIPIPLYPALSNPNEKGVVPKREPICWKFSLSLGRSAELLHKPSRPPAGGLPRHRGEHRRSDVDFQLQGHR